jgi:hypothetical protein
VDTGPSPFERAALGELQTAIIAVLARLDPRHRQALLLRTTSGLPYRTIADMLRVPVATAKHRIFRARQQLREELIQLRAASRIWEGESGGVLNCPPNAGAPNAVSEEAPMGAAPINWEQSIVRRRPR